MERLLIILAVLVSIAACVAIVRMSAGGRRPPLRLGRELDADDEDLLIGSLGAPRSPIDRSAQVLDLHGPGSQVPGLEPPVSEPVERPGRGLPDAAR